MFWLLMIIAVVLMFWLIVIYNNLQRMMQAIREQHSNILASLKKKMDLANQIIDIASGYGEHEKLTHISIGQSQNAMQELLALGQSYPQLRANETYQNLMNQLENLEQSILERREKYNAYVRHYNSYRNAFPQILIASKLSFEIVSYFELDEHEFTERAKIFERDDTQALQGLLQSGGRSVSELKSSAIKSVKRGFEQVNPDKKNTENTSDNDDVDDDTPPKNTKNNQQE